MKFWNSESNLPLKTYKITILNIFSGVIRTTFKKFIFSASSGPISNFKYQNGLKFDFQSKHHFQSKHQTPFISDAQKCRFLPFGCNFGLLRTKNRKILNLGIMAHCGGNGGGGGKTKFGRCPKERRFFMSSLNNLGKPSTQADKFLKCVEQKTKLIQKKYSDMSHPPTVEKKSRVPI